MQFVAISPGMIMHTKVKACISLAGIGSSDKATTSSPVRDGELKTRKKVEENKSIKILDEVQIT